MLLCFTVHKSSLLCSLEVYAFDALMFPKEDKIPTNESNIFRGEEVDVLFMTHLSNCEANHPLGIC